MPRPSTRRPARKRAGQYHHGGLRDALIRATVATIQRDGVDAVTLRAVGAVLGVSRTALYRHFTDKADLLAAVAAQGFEALGHALVTAWDERGHDLDGLREMGRAYV